jgi:hypothetical protein
MSEEFVVLEQISEMMSQPQPLPLMSEEVVVLEQISEMMMPLPLMPEEFVACCCHYS